MKLKDEIILIEKQSEIIQKATADIIEILKNMEV